MTNEVTDIKKYPKGQYVYFPNHPNSRWRDFPFWVESVWNGSKIQLGTELNLISGTAERYDEFSEQDVERLGGITDVWSFNGRKRRRHE